MSEDAFQQLRLVRHTLDNGLRVVLQPDAAIPLVAVNLWIHVGSRNERPGRTGFAHLFEHMLFQGSEHVGSNDHFRLVQEIGGVANGSTWYDRTAYHETLPAHHLERALWLESDRLGFLLPALDEAKLETQRAVVMNERRQRVDNQPYGRALERLHELLFPPDHPYHWPVIGYMDDIAAASLDEVREFFRTHYTPNNAVLSIAGDVEPQDALEAVERWFGPIPRGPEPPEVTAEAPPLGGPCREVMEAEVGVVRVYVSCRTPPFGDPGWYAADLLATAWSSGKSSSMWSDLVYRRELAQDVAAYVLPTEMAGMMTIVATARPGVDAEELEAAIGEHLDRTLTAGIGEADLARATNRALTVFFADVQKLDHRADLLSQLTTFFDEPERIFGLPDAYRAVTPEAVRELAAGHLAPEARATVTVVPENGA